MSTFVLSKDNANKITSVNHNNHVVLPNGVFDQGEMLMLFNNTSKFSCLESCVPQTYKSGSPQNKTMIEWPPKSIANVVFVEKDLAVVTVEV